MSRDVHTADLSTEVVLVFLRQLGDLLKFPGFCATRAPFWKALSLSCRPCSWQKTDTLSRISFFGILANGLQILLRVVSKTEHSPSF